jgi:hypothetical protein
MNWVFSLGSHVIIWRPHLLGLGFVFVLKSLIGPVHYTSPFHFPFPRRPNAQRDLQIQIYTCSKCFPRIMIITGLLLRDFRIINAYDYGIFERAIFVVIMMEDWFRRMTMNHRMSGLRSHSIGLQEAINQLTETPPSPQLSSLRDNHRAFRLSHSNLFYCQKPASFIPMLLN